MTIAPTDWVWFTFNGLTQYGRFEFLNPELQYSIDRLFTTRHNMYFTMFDVYEKLDVHAVFPKEVEQYNDRLRFMLFHKTNGRSTSLNNLPDSTLWMGGKAPKYALLDSLNVPMSRSAKKWYALKCVEWLCKFITIPEPPTFKERTVNKYWDKHDQEIIKILTRLKTLEENPMKVKRFLVELQGYDKKKDKAGKTSGKVTTDREHVLLKFKETHPVNENDVVLLLESIYVDATDAWDVTQSILSIGDGHYKLGSGNMEYSEERFNKISGDKGLLEEINMVFPAHFKFYYKINSSEFKNGKVTGEEYIRIPKKVRIKKVLEFYQQKYPKKNYSLDSKSTKKELSERSKKLKDLPAKGETPGGDLRKVCYKPKGGVKVFRGYYKDVKKLVDSGDYEFTQKARWKSQQLNEDSSVDIPGTANKSNITHPLTKDKPLGTRKEKRKERDDKRQLKSIRSVQERYHRQGTKKPGDAERKLQSEKDKKKYADMVKASGKPRTSYRASRSFEAVILGDKAEVLATLHIKAKSSEQAEKILSIIVKNKRKGGKLTGNIRDWKKKTGKNRK